MIKYSLDSTEMKYYIDYFCTIITGRVNSNV